MSRWLFAALLAAGLALSGQPAQAAPGPPVVATSVGQTIQRDVVVAPVSYRFRVAVRHLVVHRQTHQASYDRDTDFGDWIDQGGSCDTRAAVLKDESLSETTQNDYCTIESGRWLSQYDGRIYTDPGDLQVDHVVPVANAWAAGAWHWTQATRVAYYNDLTDPRSLVAVDSHDNESKSDQTPDEWLPPVGDCRYARDFTSVKLRWGLSVTRAEESALTNLATTCPNRRIRYQPASVRME